MKTVTVQDAKMHPSRLLREVEAGEVVAIARGGRVIAWLMRAADTPTRQWGVFEGQVRVDADAFAPMTAEEEEAWHEGSMLP